MFSFVTFLTSGKWTGLLYCRVMMLDTVPLYCDTDKGRVCVFRSRSDLNDGAQPDCVANKNLTSSVRQCRKVIQLNTPPACLPCLCSWQTLRSCVVMKHQACQRASHPGPMMHCCRGHRLLRREPVAQRRHWPEPWRTCTNSSQ